MIRSGRLLSFILLCAAMPLLGQTLRQEFPPYPGDASGRTETVSVEVTTGNKGLRNFALSTTQSQRDSTPKQRVVIEHPDDPRVRSANPLFDALFTMALDDARLNSVSEIRDGSYNEGLPIPCNCFQTGEKWSYVWTRDLSYAAHLGLAWLDPQRVVNSLLFKTSGFRAGVALPPGVPEGSTQIVQDTGSGGSWPVSTDRVTWAWGAQAALDVVTGEGRAAFARQAWSALRGTLEADRIAAFDAGSGLYGGEQSFLDWRTQSYAPWIVNNLSRMSGSKALSTNVSHYQALRLAVQLANEQGDKSSAQRYGMWAEQLGSTINRVFWLEDVKQYSSLTTDDNVPMALHKFDLLGTALVVIAGVAPPSRAADALARYPHALFGAPVISPQQPGVYVYHNRATWPFVSAYALRAAAVVRNPAIAGHALESLQRAAALNLSNMENIEWLTGKPQFDDGPAINSRRQLWSVAAYLSAVAESVFGVHVTPDGLRMEPFLTTAARRSVGAAKTSTLSNLRLYGRTLSVTLQLPRMPKEKEAVGYYPLAHIMLNGREVKGTLRAAQLDAGSNQIVLRFGSLQAGDSRIHRVAEVDPLSHTDPRAFAPEVPVLHPITRQGDRLQLRFDAPQGAGNESLRYNIYRDGELAAAALTGLHWTDTRSGAAAVRHCYTVEAIYVRTGQHSHTSEPACFDDAAVISAQWGAPFTLEHAGHYRFELLYDNHAYALNTGVTNAVKLLRVVDGSGREVLRGVVQMPHIEEREGSHPLRLSTALRATLPAGTYSAELLDFFNMSYLQSNASYSGAGGSAGPMNTAHIESLRIIALPAAP